MWFVSSGETRWVPPRSTGALGLGWQGQSLDPSASSGSRGRVCTMGTADISELSGGSDAKGRGSSWEREGWPWPRPRARGSPPRGDVQAARVTCMRTCLEVEGPGPSLQPGARHPRTAERRRPPCATSKPGLVEGPACHGACVVESALPSAAQWFAPGHAAVGGLARSPARGSAASQLGQAVVQGRLLRGRSEGSTPPARERPARAARARAGSGAHSPCASPSASGTPG